MLSTGLSSEVTTKPHMQSFMEIQQISVFYGSTVLNVLESKEMMEQADSLEGKSNHNTGKKTSTDGLCLKR